MSTARAKITGVVLAGGRGTRLGGEDKGLLPLAGRAMIGHVLAALRPQVGPLLISANRNLQRYRAFAYPVVTDQTPGFAGPLAGMAAALARTDTPLVVFAPCDAPLLPTDYVARLAESLERSGADVAVAHDGQRWQPAHLLLRRYLRSSLVQALAAGEHGLARWAGAQRHVTVDFSDHPEMFTNVNTPGALAELAERLEGRP